MILSRHNSVLLICGFTALIADACFGIEPSGFSTPNFTTETRWTQRFSFCESSLCSSRLCGSSAAPDGYWFADATDPRPFQRSDAATLAPFTPVAAATEPAPAPSSAAPTVSPPELDRAIQDTIQHRKYTWRGPRTKEEKPDAISGSNNGFLTRFFERVNEMLSKWARGFGNWLDRLMRRLFRTSPTPIAPKTSGYNWILLLQFLLWVLAAAVLVGIGIFIYRLIRDRRPREEPIASEAIQPTPDLTDENVGAEQLPEDGWTKLARELLARGEFRLALRAFYLSSLAHLAGRNLITLARFKSNRDYERELGRRAHSFPELLSTFGQNVSVFDRIWYGLHEINGDLVNEFATNVDRIKTGA
jgi:hypothetical protein